MGHNPIPAVPLRRRSVEDMRLEAARRLYVHGEMIVEDFEQAVASILAGEIDLDLDKRLFSEFVTFSPFTAPPMQEIKS